MHIQGVSLPSVVPPQAATRPAGERLPVDSADIGGAAPPLPSSPQPGAQQTPSTPPSSLQPGAEQPLSAPRAEPEAPRPRDEGAAWKDAVRLAERREQLADLSDPELCNSDDPLVARAACFKHGRPLPPTTDPLALLYQPFEPGDETATLSKNQAFTNWLEGKPEVPDGLELPDTRGRVVPLAEALIDRLVHDPGFSPERTALKTGRRSSWDGAEGYYALIKPTPQQVNDLFTQVETALAEKGSTGNLDKPDRVRVSILASLPLDARDEKRLDALLFPERLEERNWLGDLVDERIRRPRWDALLAEIGQQDTMHERLAAGRELFAMGMSLHGGLVEHTQMEATEKLVQALQPISPVALQLRADEIELPAQTTAIPSNEDLVPYYELAALLRCPGVDVQAGKVLAGLGPSANPFGRERAARDFLAWACVEHEMRKSPEAAGMGMQAAYDFGLGTDIATTVCRHLRANPQPMPEAREVLTNLPDPEDLDGPRTATVVRALIAAEHDPELRQLAAPAVRLLFRDDAPGTQHCAQWLHDELVPSMLAQELPRLPELGGTERTDCLRSLLELTQAARLYPGETLASVSGIEREMLATLPLDQVVATHDSLTRSSRGLEVGWHLLQASQDTLEQLEQRKLPDFEDMLGLLGARERDQAFQLATELGRRTEAGEDRQTVRNELLRGLVPADATPSTGIQQRDGALQVGGVRLRMRTRS